MKQRNRSLLYRLSMRSLLGLTLFTLPASTLSPVFTLFKGSVLAQQPNPATESATPQIAQSEMDPASIEPVIRTDDPMQIQPQNPSPEWAPTIDPQMMAVVEQLTALGPPPYPQLTGAQAREAPTATSAVMEILRKTGTAPVTPEVDVSHQVIPGPVDQGILVRTYTPLQGDGPFPVIVYYHGGGWVIANVDTYEPSARALAARTGAIVVSVAYRQAPENPFPAAHEDAFAAYEWARENAGDINGDPTRVAVAGESAGGNLAVATALLAKERGIEMPEHILAVYPVADGDVESPSYDEYANAKPLNRPFMEWFFENYIGDPDDFESPLISLVDADVSGLPPTTIINAEIDPLRSEGEDLAMRMKEAGVPVVQQTFPGVTHEFFGMAAILEQAVNAQELAASRLRESLSIGMTEETGGEMSEEILDSQAGRTIVDEVANSENESFSLLERALNAAGLEATLSQPGPYTLFAPTDQAFGELPQGALDLLLQPENQDLLRNVLTYHVVPEAITISELSDGGLESLGGGLAVRVYESGPVINNATAIAPSTQVDNGVVIPINRVLIPVDVQQQLATQLGVSDIY